MKEWLKTWEPVDVIAVIAVIGLLVLLALGMDGVLKGAFVTTLGLVFKRAMGAFGTKRRVKPKPKLKPKT